MELVRKQDIQPLTEHDGRYRNYPVFPFTDTRRFEMYMLEIDADGQLSAEAHPQGAQEFITVFAGEITVKVNGEQYIVANGNSIRFKADMPHFYHNTGTEQARLSMIIYYS